jgi:hypothetical protein
VDVRRTELSAELDSEVEAYLAERARRTAEEFGKVPGELPVLEWGDRPEFRVTGDGRPRIFVARDGADWWRIRYQIAHEVFHWLCGPRVFHWSHELLAVETAIRALAAIGELDYARRNMETLKVAADLLPLDGMLLTPLDRGDPYPPGLHARAWVTGRQLTGAVGWVRMKLLADRFDSDGKPDVVGWIRSLPVVERSRVEAVLGVPSSAWV